MKIIKIALALLLTLLCVTFAGDSIPPIPEKEVPREPVKEEKREPYEGDLSRYLTMGDISAVQAEFEDPTVCTEAELDAQVFQILLAAADFEEKGPKLKAERYNKVTVTLQLLQEGTVLEDYTDQDYDIVIGLKTSNPMHIVLGEALMGAGLGENRTAEYTFPDTVGGGDLAGQKVVLSATVKKIYRQIIPELIDATVVELFGGTFQTVKEFRESVREDILEQKELAKAQAVWLAVKNSATVHGYPEQELEDYIALYVADYTRQAQLYGITLEQLVTVYLETDMESFEAEAGEAAEEKVKNDMIFTQLVRMQGITLSEEEYQTALGAYYEREKSQFGSLEEFVEYYNEENLRQSILWDKALKAVVDRAIPIA